MQDKLEQTFSFTLNSDLATINKKINVLFITKTIDVLERINYTNPQDYVLGYIQTLPKEKQLLEVLDLIFASCSYDFFKVNLKQFADGKKLVKNLLIELQNESFDFSQLKNIILKALLSNLNNLTDKSLSSGKRLHSVDYQLCLGAYDMLFEKLEILTFFDKDIDFSIINSSSLSFMSEFIFCNNYENYRDNALKIIKGMIIKDNAKTKEESLLSYCLNEKQATIDILKKINSSALQIDYAEEIENQEKLLPFYADINKLVDNYYGKKDMFKDLKEYEKNSKDYIS